MSDDEFLIYAVRPDEMTEEDLAGWIKKKVAQLASADLITFAAPSGSPGPDPSTYTTDSTQLVTCPPDRHVIAMLSRVCAGKEGPWLPDETIFEIGPEVDGIREVKEIEQE